MHNTSSLLIQDAPIPGLLAQQIANPTVTDCLECSEKIDAEHQRKHSIFLLARHEAEENG